MNDPHDRDLLHDLLDGRLPEDEAERLRRRILSDSDLRREHDELARLLAELASLRGERVPRDLRNEVMAAARGERPSSRRPGPRDARILWAVAAAAAVVLAAAAALLRDHGIRSPPPDESRAHLRDGSESRRGAGTPRVNSSSGEIGETGDRQAPPPPAAPAPAESRKDATFESDGAPPTAPAKELRPNEAERTKEPAIRGAKPAAVPGTPPPLPVEPPKIWRFAMSDREAEREAGRAVEPRFEVEFAPLRSAVLADPAERHAALAELTSEQQAIVAPALKDSPERIVVLRLDSAGREALLALARERDREVEELVAVAGANDPKYKDADLPREDADAGIAWRRIERGPDRRAADVEPITGGAGAKKQLEPAGGAGEKSKPAARSGADAGKAKGELGGLPESEKSASDDDDRAKKKVAGPSTPATQRQTLILILRP